MSGLFTVLIAEKKHIDAIRQENKLFFEPFLESKNLAFCYWNPEGQSLQDSVPGLLDAVGRRQNWRVVIINSTTKESIKLRNPFDIVDYSAAESLQIPQSQTDSEGESWDSAEVSWKAYYEALAETKEAIYKNALEHPLQKLSTWLCFRPEDYVLNDIQEKQDAYDWAMERLTRDEVKLSTRLEMMEKNQYKRELRMKENIRRAFSTDGLLDISYPAEVHCLSLRTAENSFFDPDSYWNIRNDNEYSAFADRNMYFDKMRFLVFDILPASHRNFRSDYVRFLASVLIFASNPVPSSAMQCRRLYALETKIDDTPLCTLVTSYDKKLSATWDVIQNEMDKIRSEIPGELTDKAAEALFCTPKDISIALDSSCDPDKVLAEKDYGLFFDSPVNESEKWNRDYHVSEKALDYIVRQQARSVRKSVRLMHQSSEVADENISRLTALQIDDIRDFTDNTEDEMVASTPPVLADTSTYTQRMHKEAENVKRTIRGRMTKKMTVVLSAVSIGMYALSILPFLLDNSGSAKKIMTAIILCLLMLCSMAGVLFVTLFALRAAVIKAIEEYNRTAAEIMNEIQLTLKQVSKYLSASCNVRRGHAVQNYARRNLDEYTKSLRIRKKHQEDIRKRRAYLEEDYYEYFGDRSVCDETMCRPYEYDFDEKTEYAYPAPFLSGDTRQIEFISKGNLVTVPFSYVTGILVRLEGIYEK